MKNLMRTLYISGILLIYFQAFSQQTQPTSIKNIPLSVQQTFIKKFPELNSNDSLREAVKWQKNNGGYLAFFHYNKEKMSAVFDPSGMLKDTEMEVAKENLPPAALKALEKEYHNTKFNKFTKVTYPNGKITFKAFAYGINLVFADGKLTRQK